MKWITSTNVGIVINVRVLPGASRNEISGILNDSLKIRLQSPPVEGKANKALIKFLAGKLDIAKNKVSIISGEHSRDKRILIEGLTAEKIHDLLHIASV